MVHWAISQSLPLLQASYVVSSAYSFLLETVDESKKLFTRRQVRDPKRARSLYQKILRPTSQADFQTISRQNLIRNCPVTPDDAKRALQIFGPDVAVPKGNMTTPSASAGVPGTLPLALPHTVAEFHSNITLCVDLFFGLRKFLYKLE